MLKGEILYGVRGWEVRCLHAGCGETLYGHASVTTPPRVCGAQNSSQHIASQYGGGGKARLHHHPQDHTPVVPPGQRPPVQHLSI